MERLRIAGAGAGAAFAVLTLIAFAIASGPSSARGVDVVEYYIAHGDAAIWQAVVAGFGIVCFLWFAATFANASSPGAGVIVTAAVVACVYLIALGAWEAVAETYKDVDIVDVPSAGYGDAHVLYDVGVGAAHMASFANAAFVGATTLALAARQPGRRVLVAIGAALTAIWLVNAPLQIFGTADWTDAVGTVVFLTLLAWVFVLSVTLVAALRRGSAV